MYLKQIALPLYATALWNATLCLATAQNWTQTSAPANNWSAIAVSRDLTALAATVGGGGIYRSTNAGTNWSLSNAPSNNWVSITSSTNAASMLAAVAGGGVWISADSGLTWGLSSAPSNNWAAVAASEDGIRDVAVGENAIWTSTNSGLSWSLALLDSNNFISVSSAADGSTILAGQAWAGNVWLSQDAGVTWQAEPNYGSQNIWPSVTSSADGTRLAASASAYAPYYFVYTSTNSGSDWDRETAVYGLGMATVVSSADGTRLFGIEGTNSVCVSVDWGATWTSLGAPTEPWTNLAVSADGNELFAVTQQGVIYTWRLIVPVIVSQPESETNLGGLSTTLSAGAIVGLPAKYQWLINGTNIPGATNLSITLTNLNPGDSGTYTVLLTNAFGGVLTSKAVLAVVPAFVSTLAANYGISDAILAGSVSTGSNSTAVWFNWGLTTNYGNSSPPMPVANGLLSSNFSNEVTGLAPFTTYHCQAAASNSMGVVLGSDSSFTTAPRFIALSGLPRTVQEWSLIAWSADGSRMAVSGNGFVYVSADSGATWTPTPTPASELVCSADGARIVSLSGTVAHLSTNFGVTWTSNFTSLSISSLVAAGDAVRLMGIAGTGIYSSTNSGVTWTQSSAPNGKWIALAASADGTRVIAAADYDPQITEPYVQIYRTTNWGAIWEPLIEETPDYATGVAISANGSNAYVLGQHFFYQSFDGGNDWSSILADDAYGPIVCSASGSEVVVFGGPPGISPNFGTNWFPLNYGASGSRGSVVCTADGSKLALANGSIFIAQSVPFVPTLSAANVSNNFVLSWLVPASTFILQQSSDLVNWSTVTNAPQLNITNLQNQVALPLSQTQTFFRLKTP